MDTRKREGGVPSTFLAVHIQEAGRKDDPLLQKRDGLKKGGKN